MSSSERLRLQVSPWLALLLGAFVLLSSPALLAALLTAALVHELAHWAVLRRLGGEVRSLQLGLFGARMEIAHPERLSYGGEMLVTAAGPLVNLLLAPGLAWLGREAEVFWLFAGAQLVLGCFNLLPVPTARRRAAFVAGGRVAAWAVPGRPALRGGGACGGAGADGGEHCALPAHGERAVSDDRRAGDAFCRAGWEKGLVKPAQSM